MLEAIRSRSNSKIAKFIIALIIVPFAFAGVYSYFGTNTSNAVATVNGDDISLVEFDRAYRFQQQNWGDNFDKYFNTDERIQQFRMNILQQVINQRLSSQAISEMGLRTSDERLRAVIMNIAEFQDENGQFDLDRYQIVLQGGGFTPKQYQASRKSDMAANQLLQMLDQSNFVLKNELTLNKSLQNQTRDVDYLIIPQDYFAAQVNLDNEEGKVAINSYYEMNKSQFSIPEKVSIEYLYLTRQNASDIVISDGQIAEYYQDNESDFEANERRHLAHILIAADADADQETDAAAKLKIEQLASRLSAGESFEELAMEASDDSGTAEFGGDLDWIEEGMMDEAFEAAAFSIDAVNSVSGVVRSDYGYHLIKLLGVEEGGIQPLANVKQQITIILQEQFVEDRFFDLKEAVSEKAFEMSDSLTEVAELNGLEIRNTGLFDRQFGLGLPAELQNQPAVIDSVFSEDVLYQGLNSELVELSDGNAIVLRVLEHQESGTSPLEDVTERIVTILTSQQARESTEKLGNDIIAALKEGKTAEESMAVFPAEIKAEWQQQDALGRQGTEMNAQLRDAIFSIPKPGENQTVQKGILLGTGDYAVVSLKSVNEGTASDDPELDIQLESQFKDFHYQEEVYGYLKYLDSKASISRSVANMNLVQ